jgi:sterol desaturase/sphingolipid hydroxylase (fatty acid hydroxylase superfamily)
MANLIATTMDAVSKRLTGPTGFATTFLLLSIVISAAIVFLRSDEPKTLSRFLRFMLPADILTHASARADFSFWISRKLVMLLIALPTGASITVACGYISHAVLATILGDLGHASEYLTVPTLVLFTITMLLAYDISYYLYHNLQHRIPILWELHKVHHSAEVMVGTTKDRIHPIDDVMNRVWDGLITGPVYGFWLFFAFDPVELTILGVNVYVLRNIIMMDFVRHTHLKISFGSLLNSIILCPHYHQLHHSTNPKHFDRNFGLMLSIWDRLFGTLYIPEPNESFSFGLGHESREYQSTFGLYVLPLRKIRRLLSRERAEALAHAPSPVQVGTAQLGISSRQKDHVA